MPINNITQTISELPAAGRRGVDVQTQFVIKQEDFQDHLQGITVVELNTFKDQLNLRIGEINSTVTTINGYASTASTSASTATTKAGEASTSASEALTSKNQASTFATNSSNSATKASQWADNNYNVEVETGRYSAKHWSVVAENVVGDAVKLTGNQTITGTKTFSSNIAGSITGNSATATKLATARTINGVSFDGSANIVAPTNLGITAGTTAGPIVTSSTGTNATLPTASATASGVVTIENQTVAGIKTFTSSPIVPKATSGNQALSFEQIAYDADTSSCIPNTLANGVIIIKGSNANGEYVAFADGTLICRKCVMPFTSDIGGQYFYFPNAFIDSAYCMKITYLSSGRSPAVTFVYNPINPAYAHVFANIDGSLSVSYIAIGRWK